MDSYVKDPKTALTQTQGDKLHKSCLILSFASILLTLALFVRTERVARDTDMMDFKFTKQIQRLQEAMNEISAYRDRQKGDLDIATGGGKYSVYIYH